MKDYILINGTVYDPETRRLEKRDIAVSGGVIADARTVADKPGTEVFDLREAVITPGLIDMHCHIYPMCGVMDKTRTLPTIDGEAHMFSNGVTTAVDAGTCGCRDFFDFKERFIDHSKLRILAFVNIAYGGMADLATELEPENFFPDTAAAIAREIPEVVGIKTAHYHVGRPFDERHPAWASVEAAVTAGELAAKPVMADVQPYLPGRSYEELILKKLRSGDIHTHVYAQQFPILDKKGKVQDFIWQARKRGVVFDLGHGAGSFWFRNAVPAFDQGFCPDTLSTDLYLDNINGPVFGLLNVMSKYLNIGMPLEEVLYRTTARPAEILGRKELASIKPGSTADLAVLNIREGKFGFSDSGHARMDGDKMLECSLTIRNGEMVYNPMALGMPDWKNAPQSYWKAPGVIKL